ncbi:O-antigen ligase family protein [Pseudomonas benzenivorans]|uniref:O-antigen ligase family protein n=1 Tax=Pseudomonas benzenivorans TaxID=556533 RepID=A0ABY5HER7_9PSED|nr:O-antigen ligase family protein [Pseudomonas benzenivorans]UTW09486.1 O-antigen ligase family protein [Pseudomonas benzenivorans]
MHSTTANLRQRSFTFICNWLLPLGLLCLLIGLPLLPDRSIYHKLFYALIAAPALVALLLRPQELRLLLREPIVLAFLAYAAWALLSISWSDTDASIGSLLKRPLYIFMLVAGCCLLTQQNQRRFTHCMLIAALAVLPIAFYALAEVATTWKPGHRLVGTGALDNPLLSSHLFGFFCILWLGLGMTLPRQQGWLAALPVLVLGVTLLATGSRTPLLAASLAGAWLALACWNKRSIALTLIGLSALSTLLLLYPEALLARGTSYRLELWQDTLSRISQKPWLGFGFDAQLAIQLPGFSVPFSEPHSFAIGVLYYTGIIGLCLWFAMHLVALRQCWVNRANYLFVIAGALMVYGLGGGLAEGGGILARPKEHWFLTWIPLALIAALSFSQRTSGTRT